MRCSGVADNADILIVAGRGMLWPQYAGPVRVLRSSVNLALRAYVSFRTIRIRQVTDGR
jgi:hypothetical protein